MRKDIRCTYRRQENKKRNLSSKPLKLVDQFTYLNSNISSTEGDVNIDLSKALTAIGRLSIMKKSDLIDNIEWDFFQAVAVSENLISTVSVLLYGYTTLTKRIEEKLDRNYTRMLRATLNKYWKQLHHKTTVRSLTSQLIQVRRARYAGHCWWRMNSKREIFQLTPIHG